MVHGLDRGCPARAELGLPTATCRGLARHELVTDVLTGQFAAHLKLIPSAVGLHLAATAPGVSRKELEGLLGRASAAGVELLPLSLYGVDTPPQPGLILAYGAIPTSRIAEGLDRLRRCFED